MWFDRAGVQGATLGSAYYGDLKLSPDGTRVAVTVLEPGQNSRDIWILDIARGTKTRFTFDPADDRDPVWSPDSNQIVFTSNRKGPNHLYRKPAGGGPEEPIIEDATDKASMGWSNGTLLFMAAAGSTGQDLWTVPVSSLGVPTGKPVPLIQTPFNDLPGRLSPDGRWIAYSSNESGTNEVYVAPTSGPSGVKWQISTGGGTSVEWRGDGRELYYRDDGGIVAVDVHAEGTRFEAGLPKRLISVILAGPRSTFAVSNDGQKFLAIRAREVSEAAPLTLVVNWRPQKR